MKSDKKQTMFFIGLALMAVGVILIIYSIATPRVYETVTAPSGEVSVSVNSNTSAKTTQGVTYPLNLNTATVEELATIPDIGEVRAGAIVEYREVLGGYTSVEQIKEIKGFSDALCEQIAPYVTVS